MNDAPRQALLELCDPVTKQWITVKIVATPFRLEVFGLKGSFFDYPEAAENLVAMLEPECRRVVRDGFTWPTETVEAVLEDYAASEEYSEALDRALRLVLLSQTPPPLQESCSI